MHYTTKLETKEFLPFLEYYMHKYESLEPLVKISFTYKITKEIYEQNNLLEEKYLEKIGKHKEEHPEIEFTKDYLLTSLLKTRNKQQHLVDERNEAIKQNATLKEENQYSP
jgi:hypothetical protein